MRHIGMDGKQRRPPRWTAFRFTDSFLPVLIIRQSLANTHQHTVQYDNTGKIAHLKPGFFQSTPAKEIEGNFQPNVDCGELTHLILRVLTSWFCFLGVTSTVLITFDIKSEGRNKKTASPFPLTNTTIAAGGTLMLPTGVRNRVSNQRAIKSPPNKKAGIPAMIIC